MSDGSLFDLFIQGGLNWRCFNWGKQMVAVPFPQHNGLEKIRLLIFVWDTDGENYDFIGLFCLFFFTSGIPLNNPRDKSENAVQWSSSGVLIGL